VAAIMAGRFSAAAALAAVVAAISAGFREGAVLLVAGVLPVTGETTLRTKHGNDSAADYFTPAEQEQIRQAVATAEKATSGEIATMVVPRSDSYREAVTLGAVLGAATVALIIAVVSHHVTIWSYLPLTMVLFFPLHLLVNRFPVLQRPFIAPSRLNEAVRERAVRAFYEKGLYRTQHETGVLIFISLFEHKVWILGDRGINAKIPADAWGELVGILTAGIKAGKACEALCEVVSRCGDELARHFPRKADDSNELQDEILSGR
jgi:putative membrane protein